MSTQRASLVRAITATCAAAASITAGAATMAPANALPIQQPAFTSHDFRHDFVAGDPIPLGFEIVDVATNGTGVTRFSATPMCNVFVSRQCNYDTRELTVTWLNPSNGQRGSTVAGATATFVTTGRGPVVIEVTGPSVLSIPTFGLVNS